MQEAVQQLRDQLVEQKRRRRGKRGGSIESCSLWSGSTGSLGQLPTQQEMGHGKMHSYEGLQPELLTQVGLWHQPRCCLSRCPLGCTQQECRRGTSTAARL